MRNAKLWWSVVSVLVLGFSVALGQRAEDKTVEEKMKEARKAQLEGAEKPARRLATVYLRGDAVGQHLDYIPSATNMPTVQGELTRMDAEWVVLTSRSGKDSMISRSAVLMVVIDGR